jgi:anti-sigma regulatory factor (Ser/Thr protein kinase)
VEDEGGGFDRAAVPDPTEDCNLMKASGRGIHLIETYMHIVEWSSGGRRLRMVRLNKTKR